MKNKIVFMLIVIFCGMYFNNVTAEKLSSGNSIYISEIILVGKNYTSKEDPKSILISNGYTVIDYNLNKGTGSGDDIFLGFKTTNYYPDAIKNIKVLEGQKWRKNMKEEVDLEDGRKYKICPFAGDNHFVDLKGDLNSNAGGKDIHIFYTKEEDKNKTAISNITVDNNSSGSVDGINLNWKAKKTKIKIYLHTQSIEKGEINMVKMTKPCYISDIKLVGQEKFDGAIPLLEKEGYKVINYDLNKNASGHYIYLGYKVSSDYKDAIKDLIIKSGEEYKDKNTIDLYGRTFIKCSLAGDDRFVNSNKGDLNTKSSGDWLFLYYTKEENNSKNAICKLTINNESKGAISGKNLNEKAGGDDIYIHIDRLDYKGRSYINEINPSNWMSYILDDVKITDLNIIGAHNAATIFQGKGECQSYHIGKQEYTIKKNKSYIEDGLLERGVRHLDITYGLKNSNLKEGQVSDAKFVSDHLKIVQGGNTAKNLVKINGSKKTYSDTTNDKLMKWIKNFLDENPNETVILDITIDDSAQKEKIESYVADFFVAQITNPFPNYPEIYMEGNVPTLGEARGKVVVILNYHARFKNFVDIYVEEVGNVSTVWCFEGVRAIGDEKNKTLGRVKESIFTGHSLYIDNKYDKLYVIDGKDYTKSNSKIENIMLNEKWTWVKNGLRDAPKCRNESLRGNGTFYHDAFILIYTSANETTIKNSKINNNPGFYAKYINPKVKEYIDSNKQNFMGILVMDFVDNPKYVQDISKTIWKTNFYRS